MYQDETPIEDEKGSIASVDELAPAMAKSFGNSHAERPLTLDSAVIFWGDLHDRHRIRILVPCPSNGVDPAVGQTVTYS